ncbi:hypothetical protein niasHS_008035 [Heterodera schachtii]|uniref:Arabinogalactan endo-beta-1,4-galactanase n=1 Tax=Heterodera schachtii TaxID=97005 RepID=A0ABD2J7Z6_HETSC
MLWPIAKTPNYAAISKWINSGYKASKAVYQMPWFGKKVLVAELGMKWSDADASEAMLADMFTRVKAMGNNGIGVFYWEPNLTPDHYEMGAMDSLGKFTKAITSYNRY